jgi:formylglycine-generating enzyme required for sulfatase activity
MGCVSGKGCDDDELPVHTVTFKKPFAMGKYEVTFEEYELFARLTGRPVPGTAGWGKGRRPAINVSWEDARDYAEWLAQETGQHHRLPTEAEWEYAARGGTTTPFWTGAYIDPDQPYDGEFRREDFPEIEWVRGRTEEVGSLLPNPWGLHDVHGNVEEWVQDCWHRDYHGAPGAGTAWLETDGGDCTVRVLRGGAWDNFQVARRSASRNRGGIDYRFSTIGFRLAQDL